MPRHCPFSHLLARGRLWHVQGRKEIAEKPPQKGIVSLFHSNQSDTKYPKPQQYCFKKRNKETVGAVHK